MNGELLLSRSRNVLTLTVPERLRDRTCETACPIVHDSTATGSASRTNRVRGSPGEKLANMATQIDAARLLMYRAAWLKDQKRKVTKESSMAKLFASEISVNVCEEAIQIHGGYGYTKDYPAEKYWRDSKLCTIGEVTSEIQRVVIAKSLLKA